MLELLNRVLELMHIEAKFLILLILNLVAIFPLNLLFDIITSLLLYL